MKSRCLPIRATRRRISAAEGQQNYAGKKAYLLRFNIQNSDELPMRESHVQALDYLKGLGFDKAHIRSTPTRGTCGAKSRNMGETR